MQRRSAVRRHLPLHPLSVARWARGSTLITSPSMMLRRFSFCAIRNPLDRRDRPRRSRELPLRAIHTSKLRCQAILLTPPYDLERRLPRVNRPSGRCTPRDRAREDRRYAFGASLISGGQNRSECISLAGAEVGHWPSSPRAEFDPQRGRTP